MSQANYDVIIVGGRCAGATLAIRLAQQQLKVLVVDRATFPSYPAVASSPFIHDCSMRLLDELGLAEDVYSLPGSRVDQLAIEFVNYFCAVIPCSLMGLERSYIRGLDRAQFDNALWKHMESNAAYITARQGFAVSDVVKDADGKVTGIVGKELKGEDERFTADIVVGADGRHSMMAKKFGAKIVEERNEYTNGGYEALWENVLPFADGMSTEVSIYNTARGFAVLFIPVAQGRYYVAAYMRSQDVQRGKQTPEEFYLSSLQRIPKAWKRLEGARQTAELEGINPVENGYREAFGNGWALAGDALHYKDPLDGQGIYDALIETKYLAEAIAEWKSGKLTWEQAGTSYKDKVWAATYPMFKSTVERVHREVHTFPPKFIINTLIRWTLNDPGYQAKYLRVLARAIDPSELSAMPSLGMIVRGIKRSLRADGSKSPSPQPSPAQP
jgi:flavin-dependent dehydrogenase